MRDFFLKIHRWLSLPFGIIISIICFSGAILVFSDELNESANKIEVPPNSTALTAEQLIEKIKIWKEPNHTFVALHYPTKPDDVAEAQFAELGRQTVAVNPYTGEKIGMSGSQLVATTKKIHRWLMMPPTDTHGGMSLGRIIIGTTAIAMTFIIISGIILWWPRNLTMLKNRLKVCFSMGWKRFIYDSHVSLGIYAAVFLLIMSVTGPIFSFSWYRSAATAIAGGSQQETFKHDKSGKPQTPITQVTIVKKGQPQMPSSQNNNKNTSKGKLPVQVIFGQLHTGSIGGNLLRIIYFIAAIIGGLLPWSGYYLWWQKRKSKSQIVSSPRT